jgi:hypothetical protein
VFLELTRSVLEVSPVLYHSICDMPCLKREGIFRVLLSVQRLHFSTVVSSLIPNRAIPSCMDNQCRLSINSLLVVEQAFQHKDRVPVQHHITIHKFNHSIRLIGNFTRNQFKTLYYKRKRSGGNSCWVCVMVVVVSLLSPQTGE